VMDNVPTRTKLRVVLEVDGWNKKDGAEFEITELCKRMWDELNHPLEVFSFHGQKHDIKEVGNAIRQAEQNSLLEDMSITHFVPFVYMVHNRVDYLKSAIDSLRASDFPTNMPLIISHDGNVPDAMAFVQSLKDEFNVIQLFHPYACFDHPNSFPGNDPSLEESRDTYGNPRSAWATCAKHHWTWMMDSVWRMSLRKSSVKYIFFMEEDYIVSPTIYSTITTGLQLMERSDKPENYFGLIMDVTNGSVDQSYPNLDGWIERRFRTGPMVMQRRSWGKIIESRKEFCTFDDYNWDWSLVHLQSQKLIPDLVLAPSIPQVKHIGVVGMHGGATYKAVQKANIREVFNTFNGKDIVYHDSNIIYSRPNGGWRHPMDQSHCLEILKMKLEN